MSVIGDRLIEALAPYMTQDHADYLETIGEMFDEFEAYVNQFGEDEVWAPLLNVETCPAPALPYLAQFLGEVLPVGIPDEMAREWIQDHAHMRRGTPEAIAHAAQRTLIASRTVQILERSGSGANPEDYLNVVTYIQETPDPVAVLQDLKTVVPADIVLTYEALAGQTWAAVDAAYPDWAGVTAAHADWVSVAGVLAGSSVWARPQPIP